MSSVDQQSSNFVLISAAIGGLILFVVLYILRSAKSENEPEDIDKDQAKDAKARNGSMKSKDDEAKASKKKQNQPRADSKATFSHPWLVTSLKGHSSPVLSMDFSSNGKYLASCSGDRSVFLWTSKDFANKDHKSLRINIEFDHASHILWSPDSKAFIIHKGTENCAEVYKLNKKADNSGFSGATKLTTFPKQHIEDIIGFGISCNGKFIMSCSKKTDLVLWDLKGQIIATVDTYLMNNYRARISPCGRFVAASGFAPDVKIWEVVFSKSGDFQSVNRAFELQGHKSGILDFSFNCDSTRMATISKDGTWKVYNTKIEYHKGEDPHLIQTGKFESHSQDGNNVAISPDGLLVVCTTGASASFFSVETGKCEAFIEDIHTCPISCVLFDSTGDHILTAGDKHIRVFRNVVGAKVKLHSLRSSLKTGSHSSAMKDRIQEQMNQLEQFLKKQEFL